MSTTAVASQAERSTRANFIQRKIDEIYQDLEEQDRFKKDKINHLAGYYKEQVALGELKIELKDIAKLIIGEIEKRGLDIDKSFVYRCVPDDCKNSFEKESVVDGEKKWINPLSEIKFKPAEQMDHADAVEAAAKIKKAKENIRAQQKLIGDIAENIQKKADANGWSDVELENKSKSTPQPERRITKMVEAFKYGAGLFTDLAEKAEAFPSEVEEEEYHAQSVYQLLSIFAPMTDEKYSNDLVSPAGQLQMQKYNLVHGKHAAAVKFGITTPSGEYRPMTREQVGDSFEETVDKTTELYNAIPGITGIHDWYNKRVRPYIGERKINLSPDLSEKA